jgi:hypothetical protein
MDIVYLLATAGVVAYLVLLFCLHIRVSQSKRYINVNDMFESGLLIGSLILFLPLGYTWAATGNDVSILRTGLLLVCIVVFGMVPIYAYNHVMARRFPNTKLLTGARS